MYTGRHRASWRRSARYDGLGAPDQQRGVHGSGHLRGARLRAPQGCAAQGTSVSVSKMTSLSKKSSASSGAGPCGSRVGLGFT